MKNLISITLALVAPLAAPVAAEPGRSYYVHLYSFAFQPSPIVLRAGVPVTLVLMNTAGIGHEFKAPYFFRASRILAGGVSYEGSVELRPHQSASVTLIPMRGTYEAHCGHFMHDVLGMETKIYVE